MRASAEYLEKIKARQPTARLNGAYLHVKEDKRMRYTRTSAEVEHMDKIYAEFKDSRIQRFAYKNGKIVEGFATFHSIGTNAKNKNPPTGFYVEVSVRMLDGEWEKVNLVEVESVVDITSMKLREYVQAGIIVEDQIRR
jgi:hypothetical protein